MSEVKLAYKILFGKREVENKHDYYFGHSPSYCVCVCVCVYVCMYVCMYVYIYIYMDLFPSSRVMGRVPTELSPLEGASLVHWKKLKAAHHVSSRE
jgi:hypothetical protein